MKKNYELVPFILIHGAYHGGWCWKKTAAILRSRGAEVYTPTLSGLGDRRHALTPDVNLSTHISDICELIIYEGLDKVELVGHSYAGMVISGVAELIPERIARLTYLDAIVPFDGQTVFDILPGTMSRSVEITENNKLVKVINPPLPQVFGVTDPKDIAWMTPRLTPMPYNCYSESICIADSTLDSIPKAYLMCEQQIAGELQQSHAAAFERAGQTGWCRRVVPGPHDAMITHPVELATIILEDHV